MIDLKRCLGCHTCTIACKLENNAEEGAWIQVETIGGPHMDTPKGKYPNVNMYYLPKMCFHCRKPACLEACPTRAIYKREDGIVLIDESKCNGCQVCIQKCPYGTLVFNPQKGIVEKCTLCSHRVDKRLEPFCVVCCMGKAMTFGDIDDPASAVSKLIHEKSGYPLKPEHGTQPSIHYLPP